ncbi:hypothetical protein QQ045_018679 [Rhodiola kirilowii]
MVAKFHFALYARCKSLEEKMDSSLNDGFLMFLEKLSSIELLKKRKKSDDAVNPLDSSIYEILNNVGGVMGEDVQHFETYVGDIRAPERRIRSILDLPQDLKEQKSFQC